MLPELTQEETRHPIGVGYAQGSQMQSHGVYPPQCPLVPNPHRQVEMLRGQKLHFSHSPGFFDKLGVQHLF